MKRCSPLAPLLALSVLVVGCGQAPPQDGPPAPDASSPPPDAATASDASAPAGDAAPSLPPDVPAPGLAHTFTGLGGARHFAFPPLDPNGTMDPPNTGGLIADVDGDGKPEVVLTFYPPSGGGQSEVYEYDGAKLVPGPPLYQPDAPTAILDLDGDGLNDLVYLGGVSWNLGGGQYQQGQLPMGVFNVGAIWDVDGNGLLDLVAASWCEKPHVVLQMAGRKLVDGGALTVGAGGIGSNSIFAGDVDGQLLLGTMGFGCMGAPSDVPTFYLEQGGAFDAVDYTPGVSFSQGAAMGATTGADLDGDGQFDLLVQLNPQHELISARKEVRTSFFNVPSPTTGKPMIPWTALLLDLDYDGRTDILYTHGADGVVTDRVAMIGPQRVTAHWNGGGGQWGRFATLGDLDALGDWRILGVGDLDDDGDPDLVVGGFGIDPRVYRNDTVGHGVGLRLVTKLGMAAFGAIVSITAAGQTQRFEVAGMATPKMVNEPIVWAGLGAATTATVDITWPDGSTQTETVTSGHTTTLREKN